MASGKRPSERELIKRMSPVRHLGSPAATRREIARRRRRRQLLRRRAGALAVLAVVIAAPVIGLSAGSGAGPRSFSQTRARDAPAPRRHPPPSPHTRPERSHFAVGTLELRLVERRTVTLAGGQVIRRALATTVYYPALGRPGARRARAGASPARGFGPFPLIVFGHGFDEYPVLYARLLRYWASAGFVVAAPEFPLEKPDAPGGPNENDLPNQPGDMTFVITRMLGMSASPAGPLRGLIDPRQVSVAGQSDGGDTALAVAYDPGLRDSRVRAAMILSGAEIPMLPSFTIAPGGPPLLAVQGTADEINPPSATDQFYDSAPAPKFLLELPGGAHLQPYSTDLPELSAVERVSVAFLRYYLERRDGALAAMRHAGRVPGVATLYSDP
jgi:fermentation-respiration switch protein FrsA (DUF1100 family)